MRTPDTEKREQGALPAALSAWLKQATDQMRWQRARPMAEKELSDHLTDQYEAFLEQGMDEDAAAQATAREMGDAVETGTQLDRAWRPQPDWVMLGIVLVVAAAGLMLHVWLGLPSLHGPVGVIDYVKAFGFGACFFLGGYFLDYTSLGRNVGDICKIWIIINVISLLAWVFGVGQIVRPEHTLWLFPLVFAVILYDQRGKGAAGVVRCARNGLLLYVPVLLYDVVMLVTGLYAVYRPIEGDALVITLLCTLLLLGAVWRGWFHAPRSKLLPRVLLVPAGGVVGTGAAYLLFELAHGRLEYFVREPQYAVNPIRQIMGNSGTQRMYQELQTVLFPAPNEASGLMFADADSVDDMLLLVAKTRWGWLGFALLLGAMVVLLVFGFRLAMRQRGVLATLTCYAVMLTLSAQTVLYVVQNLAIPFIEAPGLPLLSCGRSGVFFCQTMLLLGLLLSAQRSGQLESGLMPEGAHPVP